MVALVLVLDAVAIALHNYTPLRTASSDAKLAFTGAWTLVTLVIVAAGLTRIRAARDARLGRRR